MSGIMMALFAKSASSSGPTPGSIYFPTTSSRITLSPGITLSSTYQSPFTVEGWFYSGDTPGTDSGPVLLSTDTASSTPAYAKALTINVVSTTQIVVDSNGATATTFNLAQTLVAASWYYLAVSRDSSGFMQLWLGKQGDASAAASTSGRFNCNADTSGWALTGLSNCIGAFVPAGRYSATDYISGIRVTNTNLYITTNATIAMPTQTFGYVPGILFLQSPTDLSDLTGDQTLTSVGSAAYSATGPSIDIQTYVEPATVSFTSTGTTSWTAPAGVYTVEYLVVGGAGGAGNGYDNAGGGGGGAGMVLTGNVAVAPGTSYTVTVGAGGAGGADTRTNNPGSPGSNSVFSSITALGGGQGLGSRTGGAVGAAQIGSSTAPTGGAGAGGGSGGLGGGGASTAGSSNSGATGGSGGAGTASSITGSSVTYGVGGAGGGAGAPTTDGANGTANRGNGGQGGKSNSADSAKGGDGGSGIVVVKYGPYTWYEAFGTTVAISTTQYVGATKIYAYSSTFDVPSYQNAVIQVNDVEIVNTGNRGHTMVVLSPSGATISTNWYDTYDAVTGPANLTALANALNGVASGNRVVLVTYDASAFNADCRSALTIGYGDTNSNTWTASRISQIFVGVKS
jgi:hypothetical protein